MKKLIFVLALLLVQSVFAQSVGPQDAEMMLQQMQAAGRISASEAELTRRYMKQMDEKQWAELTKKAKDCMQRNPAAVKAIDEHGIDGISPDLCK